jgi:thiosulfate/3-mercaptopyruvate sulfurtransferase
MWRLPTILVLLLALASSTLCQTAQPAGSGSEKVRSDMLVSTEWLAKHLNDPNVVVLHVADSQSDYKRGHIPGARFLAMSKIAENSGPLNAELPSVDQLTRVFSEAGVGDNTRVVLYATNWFPNAARAWFTLDYLGHSDKAALLDGGIEQWLAEDRPTSSEIPKFAAATFTPHVRESVRALLDEVKHSVESTTAEEQEQIIDARPARRYTAGHLPGAANLYWQDTLVSEDHPVFQAPEKLRALYASRGIMPGKKIVTYCEIGLQASHAYFLARYLGYEAAMYDGSYQEWSAENLPVIKGEAKK